MHAEEVSPQSHGAFKSPDVVYMCDVHTSARGPNFHPESDEQEALVGECDTLEGHTMRQPQPTVIKG